MLNFIKQNKLAIFAVVALAFSGCNEDRSHPSTENDGNGSDVNISGNGNPIVIVYADPIAVIDVNGTKNILQSENNDTLVYRLENTNTNNPFILNCTNSYDLDENNQSIVACDWNITSTFTDGCLDINNTGNIVYVDVCDEAFNDGDINTVLTVTDDENKTASTTTLIKIN